MLIITKAQMDRLDAVHLAGFIARLGAHLRELFPAVADRPPDELDAEVADGIAEARSHGFRSERDIARYLDLRTELGAGFAADAARQWIATLFSDPEILPELRMDALFEELAIRIPGCAALAAWWKENG